MDHRQLLQKIKEISRQAKSLALKGSYAAAVAAYEQGLALLPEPRRSSEFAVMLYAGIGETYFLQHDWPQALHYYQQAVTSKDGLGDPALHFRLGQLRFELGDRAKAEDELMRAYMGSGEVIFAGEDPKYFDLIKRHITEK